MYNDWSGEKNETVLRVSTPVTRMCGVIIMSDFRLSSILDPAWYHTVVLQGVRRVNDLYLSRGNTRRSMRDPSIKYPYAACIDKQTGFFDEIPDLHYTQLR